MVTQRGHHTSRMADANHLLVVLQKAFKQVVNGHVARSACKYTFTSANRLPNQLHQRRRLPGSGRTMHDGHVLRTERERDRLSLRWIQRGIEGGQFDAWVDGGRLLAEQDIAKMSRAVPSCGSGLIQGVKLPLTGHLVRGQVEAEAFRLFGIRRLREGDR